MKKKEITLGNKIASVIEYCRTNLLLWCFVIFLTVLLFEAFHFPF